jgi:uncharacterized protein YbaR (Trm112 family)
LNLRTVTTVNGVPKHWERIENNAPVMLQKEAKGKRKKSQVAKPET